MPRAVAVLAALALGCATDGPSIPPRCEPAFEHVEGVLRGALAGYVARSRRFAPVRGPAIRGPSAEDRLRRRAEAWSAAHREELVGYCAAWSNERHACVVSAHDPQGVSACGLELEDVVRSFASEVVEPYAGAPVDAETLGAPAPPDDTPL